MSRDCQSLGLQRVAKDRAKLQLGVGVSTEDPDPDTDS